MRWQSGRRSSNVEDRRGMRVSRGVKRGGIGTIILVLVGMYFGIDPSVFLQQSGQMGGQITSERTGAKPTAAENQLADFVSVVLADTEDVWKAQFQKIRRRYQEPKLVLFTGSVQSACGMAGAATGPFYCPGDQQVYIDLSFYHDLKTKMNAPGDFAQAYVIAHEVGHHVQKLLGTSDKVHRLRQQLSTTEYNKVSVRLELQADCFSGVWANNANKMRNILEPGDVEEAMNAASMIGDDRLQKQARGYITPDSFTHGSSKQRVKWFSVGLKSGDMRQCDTGL